MSDDLRTGLVEAIAQALYEAEASWIDLRRNPWDVVVKRIRVSCLRRAEVVVDAALGFLADNAEAWQSVLYDHDWIDGETGSISGMLREFIAVLASPDTGTG